MSSFDQVSTMHRFLPCCRLLWAFCMLQPWLAALFLWCNLQISWLRYLSIASNCKGLCGQVTGFGPYMLGTARLVQLFWHNVPKTFMNYVHSCCWQDSSTHIFQDADLYVWNISVGGICLAMTSAIVSIHAWRLLQASSQKKVW